VENDFFEEGGSRKMKMAVIAGASEALKAKAQDSRKIDSDILQEVTDKVEEILKGID